MKANDYQKAALRTASMKGSYELILNGTLGLSGETGEVADHVKKYLFQGHNLNKHHLAEELGDIC
ncbi:MAG: nucleoside triphosphate pyrophosphohydrolase family protein [Clostridiaceae bacterium]|nr:nucleoside triphosphate pyrophosphohydrolase family protein [Clostridiaceae bacterium]